jgi:hypothetical protein
VDECGMELAQLLEVGADSAWCTPAQALS